MSIAFYISDGNSIGKAFAARDEYFAVFTYYVSGQEIPPRALSPSHQYFLSPYCFLPKYKTERYRNGSHRTCQGGYIVFTSQVPWLHGTPPKDELRHDRETRAHWQAKEWMSEKGTLRDRAPEVGSVEHFVDALGLKEREVYTFTPDGCYPSKEEISQDLGKLDFDWCMHFIFSHLNL